MADVPAPASDADQPIDNSVSAGLADLAPTAAVEEVLGEASNAADPEDPAVMSPETEVPIASIEASAAPLEVVSAPMEASEPEPVPEPVAQAPEPEPAPEPVTAMPEPAEATPEPSEPAEPAPSAEPIFKAAVAAPEPIAPPPAAPSSTAVIEGIPTVASTLEVPASAPGSGGTEGGEWELLLAKLRAWLASGQLQEQWQAARGPLSLLAGLIAVLLVLRVYGALMAVLDSLPLVPGLLELLGVIVVARFSLTRLVRSEERKAVIHDLQKRWQAFRGKA